MRRLRFLLLVLAPVAVAACADEGPVSGPGTLTATLLSPNGAEGAAVVSLLGDGVGSVSAVGDTDVYAYAGGGSTQVVLINQLGGTLAFDVAVADTTQPPGFVVLEVAAPDDAMRSSISGYGLEFSR